MTRPRILVMDDDPLFRSLLAATLRKDYLVSVAADGTEGYSKAVEHVPDLAVIDLQMPVCDGLTVLKAFKANSSLRHVPVMILTSDSSKESVVAAIHLGISDYVIKSSFNKDELASKVARLLSGRSKSVVPADSNRTPETAPAAFPPPAPAAATVPPAPKLAAQAAVPATSSPSLQSILDNWE